MAVQNLPPKILVETWISLINSTESNEVRDHASTMLMLAFNNDIKKIAAYCKTHGIPIK